VSSRVRLTQAHPVSSTPAIDGALGAVRISAATIRAMNSSSTFRLFAQRAAMEASR